MTLKSDLRRIKKAIAVYLVEENTMTTMKMATVLADIYVETTMQDQVNRLSPVGEINKRLW